VENNILITAANGRKTRLFRLREGQLYLEEADGDFKILENPIWGGFDAAVDDGGRAAAQRDR
jgi:hypothetical protein